MSEHPKVKDEVYFHDDKRKEGKLNEFFTEAGVKRLDDEEEIKIILDEYYRQDSTERPDSDAKHFTHIKKFLSFWMKNGHSNLNFEDYCILRDKNKRYLLPRSLYIDSPFKNTGLRSIYSQTKSKYHLWKEYRNKFRDNLIDFIVSIGVADNLKIVATQIPFNHPEYDHLAYYGNRRASGINEDFTIPDIEELLSLKQKKISQIIWDTLNSADKEYLQASFRTNSRQPTRYAYSTLVHKLREFEWVPTKRGQFKKPSEMTIEELPNNFEYDNSNGWLTAILFANNVEKSKEFEKHKEEMLKELDITRTEYEEFLKFKNIPEEKRLYIINRYTQQKPEFPENKSANPDRRKEKIINEVNSASDKEYSIKERQLRISDSEAKNEGKTYLRNFYTNNNREMICQICHEVMPFKLDNGEYYFEAVLLIRNEIDKEIKYNYLALCPICSAKYEFANRSKDQILKLFISSSNNHIKLILAGEENTLKFTETHYQDILTSLEHLGLVNVNQE